MWRLVGAAVVLLAVAGCAADPTSNPERPAGHAAASVAVTGDGVTGVRADVVSWTPTHYSADPAAATLDVAVRLRADSRWTLAGTVIELAVCAVTDRRVVVICDTVANNLGYPPDDPRTVLLQTRLSTGTDSGAVAAVLVLPDQRSPSHVPIAQDPKDGEAYVAPRFPVPGDRLR